jgi:uncharacterized protein YbcV (DUF1398 family)
MEVSVREAIENCFKASKEGSIHFGEVVRQLSSVGVESYFADYRAGKTTYYLPNGESLGLEAQQPGIAVASEFNAEAVRSAISGAQRDEVRYPEFVKLTRGAGCVGYFVWITGRHVTYLGRRGETHVEHFPK